MRRNKEGPHRARQESLGWIKSRYIFGFVLPCLAMLLLCTAAMLLCEYYLNMLLFLHHKPPCQKTALGKLMGKKECFMQFFSSILLIYLLLLLWGLLLAGLLFIIYIYWLLLTRLIVVACYHIEKKKESLGAVRVDHYLTEKDNVRSKQFFL